MLRLLQFGVFCLIVSVVSGCYNTPVRHLAADASLVETGVSTREDVSTILGTPDRQMRQDDAVVWIYEERKKDMVEDLPLLADKLGTAEQIRLLVYFRGDTVTRVEYSAVDPDDQRWGQEAMEEE